MQVPELIIYFGQLHPYLSAVETLNYDMSIVANMDISQNSRIANSENADEMMNRPIWI